VIERRNDKLLVEPLANFDISNYGKKQLPAILCMQRKSKCDEWLVPGDKVTYEDVQNSEVPGGIIVGCAKRNSVLWRPDPFSNRAAKKVKIIASNIDYIGIVVSPVPKVPLISVDQIIAFAEYSNMKPFIVINKNDLPEYTQLQKDLNFYHKILGYPIFSISSKTGQGIDDMLHSLADIENSDTEDISNNETRTVLYIGQSGVGMYRYVCMLICHLKYLHVL
jgi:ribosome biogenesis GTPase